MENAIKIFIKFSERFWPEKLQGVICADSVIPEIYFNGPHRTGILPKGIQGSPSQPQTPYYAVGLICARHASHLVDMGEQNVCLSF